ncbi:endonuclease/exonuclease/phosphatase family protein [Paenibacillus chondroitinus]|uniref:Endonuclease/exonuclease/phosphatase family protein n=1 Tax=Paenibacillus chondroitinus TaxID=59842 RepID=A0ABU6DM84_9BACL|nr:MULTISPECIES: endonuclease/exonuclease/phosphatase family protein [Paenibacillus]MCY9661980.1 endonuclease/exonuclease/phosphatase family protein [Paenibacillus anseongense]MEB4798896.1 endonuclease/exonuclease/phosphatase family protein [Paenibacillus chondroitinus]
MKVLTYNTLFGGFDGADRRRFEAQIELIRATKPDILLIQEAKNATANGSQLLFQMEQAFEMRGFIANAPHTGQNTGIFINSSVKPLSFETDSVHFHHALTILKLDVPNFEKPVTFISAHLCPFGTHVRLTEAYYLVNYAEVQNYVLLAGDFNSVSPYDPDPQGLNELPSHFRTRYVTSDGKAVDKRTLETLNQAGYMDLGHHFGQNADSTVPTATYKDSEFVPFRSDYILTTKALQERAISYKVIKNDLTDIASDHYPVIAEFH